MAKKKYVNKANGLGTVHYKDGTGTFLRRGESVEAEENKVLYFDKGIVVVEPKNNVVKAPKAPSAQV